MSLIHVHVHILFIYQTLSIHDTWYQGLQKQEIEQLRKELAEARK